jgi:sodium/bile acid cotransporter 7
MSIAATTIAHIRLQNFLIHHEFLIGMCVGVIVAKLNPNLGRNNGPLRADLWIGSFGVFVIFLLSSLATESSALRKAMSNLKLNLSIQLLSFIFWPFLIGIPLVHFLTPLLSKPLLDGILILTCLPCTINMAILLTGASGGNIATALCNTVIGNLLGIIVTPGLLLYFFGSKIKLNFVDIFLKLGRKVLLPVGECFIKFRTPSPNSTDILFPIK